MRGVKDAVFPFERPENEAHADADHIGGIQATWRVKKASPFPWNTKKPAYLQQKGGFQNHF